MAKTIGGQGQADVVAHRRLDETVFAAYGWNPDLSDEEILERAKKNAL